MKLLVIINFLFFGLLHPQSMNVFIYGNDNGSGWTMERGTSPEVLPDGSLKWEFRASASTEQLFFFGESYSVSASSGFWTSLNGRENNRVIKGNKHEAFYNSKITDAGFFSLTLKKNNYYILKAVISGKTLFFTVFESDKKEATSITGITAKAEKNISFDVNLNGTRNFNEKIFIVWTKDNWKTSSFTEANNLSEKNVFKAIIPKESGLISYYSTTVLPGNNISSVDDIRLYSSGVNNNNGENYNLNLETNKLNYQFTSSSSVYNQLNDGNQFTWFANLQSQNDDDYSVATGIGFNFYFGGQFFTQFQVHSNGFIRLGADMSQMSAIQDIFISNFLSGRLRGVIAPLWDDLSVSNSQTDITYKLTGSVGNRVLTVQWKNVAWNYSSGGSCTFQVALFESTNAIEFRYGPSSGISISRSASIGINDLTPVKIQPSVSQNYHNAHGTFISVNIAGQTGSRKYHRSNSFEFTNIQFFPDNGTVLRWTPFSLIPMNGIYTVGGTSPSFQTPSDAATALNANGVSGPVTLKIRPGVYDDVLHLTNINGTSAVNTVTITNDGGTVIFSPLNGNSLGNDASLGDAVIRLDGVSWVNMENISVTDNTLNSTLRTKYDIGILVSNSVVWADGMPVVKGSRNNIIRNINIDMKTLSGININYFATGIRFARNGVWGDTSVTNSFNLISDCDITGFYRSACFLSGYQNTNPDVGNRIAGNITRNKFHDITLTGLDGYDTRVIEIYFQKDFVIEKTDIYNISNSNNTSADVVGIFIGSGSGPDGFGGTSFIRNNNIYTLANSGAITKTGSAYGMLIQGPLGYSTSLHVSSNRIHDISTAGNTTPVAAGISAILENYPLTLNVYNNVVYNIRAPKSTLFPSVRCLSFNSKENSAEVNVFHNTLYIDNLVTPSASNHSSTCLYLTDFYLSSLDLRNNILVTKMSQKGQGRSACIIASDNINLKRIKQSSDNNSYYNSVLSIFSGVAYDFTTMFQSLIDFQNAMKTGGHGGPREQHSVFTIPPFINSSLPYNLDLQTGITSEVESGGIFITNPININEDFNGNPRNTSYPDIGAYEYSGILSDDHLGPQVIYQPLKNTHSLSNRFIDVIISDVNGVATGDYSPRLYYKKNWNGNLVYDALPIGIGNEYNFTFNYSLLENGSVSVGDTIYYYIAAQDNIEFANMYSNPAGASGVGPPGYIPPANISGFRYYTIINPPLSGTYIAGINLFKKLTGKEISFEKQKIKRTYKTHSPVNKVFNKSLLKLSDELIENTDKSEFSSYDFNSALFSPDILIEQEIECDTFIIKQTDLNNNIPYAKLNNIQIEGYADIQGVFPTLSAAISALSERGISGNTTILLSDTLYSSETFPVDINEIQGTSKFSILTIKPISGLSVKITGSSPYAALRIINSDYITIDGSNNGTASRNLTIENTFPGSTVMRVNSVGTDYSSNLTIKNINLISADDNSTGIGIYDFYSSLNPAYVSGISIDNNNFVKGRQAIFVNCGSVQQNGLNIVISNNKISNTGTARVKTYGIYMQGVDGAIISGNDIGFFESVTPEPDRGIWIAEGCKNIKIDKNKIHDLSAGTGFAANGIYISTGLSDANVLIANNFIYKISGPGSNIINLNPLGIFIAFGSGGNKIYNNSIYLAGGGLDNTSSGAVYSAGISLGSNSFADVRNNIIYNKLGKSNLNLVANGQIAVFAYKSAEQFTNLDYNIYYLPSVNRTYTTYMHINGVNDLNFSWGQYQITYGKDLNSFTGDPAFSDTSLLSVNLHVDTTKHTNAADGGINLPEVSEDIDGNVRETAPDIGADECNATKPFQSLTVTVFIEGLTRPSGVMIITDTIYVSLCNSSPPYSVIEKIPVLLGTNGRGVLRFSQGLNINQYYLKIEHRNSVETWCRLPQQFNKSLMSYDFSTSQSQAYGNNLVLTGSKWCIYSGDVNRDGQVTLDDLLIIDSDYQNFVTGYTVTDITGDMQVDIYDLLICDRNNQQFITSIKP